MKKDWRLFDWKWIKTRDFSKHGGWWG
jgi:hypothetical protein